MHIEVSFDDAVKRDRGAQVWLEMTPAQRSPKWGENGLPTNKTASAAVAAALDRTTGIDVDTIEDEQGH